MKTYATLMNIPQQYENNQDVSVDGIWYDGSNVTLSYRGIGVNNGSIIFGNAFTAFPDSTDNHYQIPERIWGIKL